MPATTHVLAFISVAASPGPLPPTDPTMHDVEIAAFASSAAVTLTASALCADILVNHDILDALKRTAHITDDDKPALTRQVQADVALFKDAIAQAPDLQTWCDTAFRLYGSPGSLVPGLLAR